jgi:hypothetical protein
MRPSLGLAAVLAAVHVAGPALAQEQAQTGAAPGAAVDEHDPAFIFRVLNGDMVRDAATALDLAETLLRHRYGEGMLKAQQPLSAHDAGDSWMIEGTSEAVDPVSNAGQVRLRINKADASVAWLYFELPRELREQLDNARRQYRDQPGAPPPTPAR